MPKRERHDLSEYYMYFPAVTGLDGVSGPAAGNVLVRASIPQSASILRLYACAHSGDLIGDCAIKLRVGGQFVKNAFTSEATIMIIDNVSQVAGVMTVGHVKPASQGGNPNYMLEAEDGDGISDSCVLEIITDTVPSVDAPFSFLVAMKRV